MNALFRDRNLWILFIGSLVAVTGSSQIVTMAGIAGANLASNKALATLPLSAHIIGIALFSVPAAMLMRRVGRARGLTIAALIAVSSMVLAIIALMRESFAGFVCATLILGCGTAFFRQLRFVAAESVATQYTGRAISFVLAGSIGGAFLGPTLASVGSTWWQRVPFAGGLLVQIVLFTLMALIYPLLRRVTMAQATEEQSVAARTLRHLAMQPTFFVAVVCAVVGYVIMSLIMTATPLSMHVLDGYSLSETASVVRIHVLGMYIPALFTGWLVDRYGIHHVSYAGTLIMMLCLGIAFSGHQYIHYWWAMMLLGVGWNFLYIAGTALLTRSYRASERHSAQGFNEFVVFSASAIASLFAGWLVHRYGWSTTIVAASLPMLPLILGLWKIRNDQTFTRVSSKTQS